jgi:hypothetical protein
MNKTIYNYWAIPNKSDFFIHHKKSKRQNIKFTEEFNWTGRDQG